jgi:hypothetical protein
MQNTNKQFGLRNVNKVVPGTVPVRFLIIYNNVGG